MYIIVYHLITTDIYIYIVVKSSKISTASPPRNSPAWPPSPLSPGASAPGWVM